MLNDHDTNSVAAKTPEAVSKRPKRAYRRTRVTPTLQHDFDICSRMAEESNPFLGTGRIPSQEVRDFYQAQKQRTQLGLTKLYSMLSKDARAGTTLLTLQSSLMNGSRQPTIPAFIAAGMWDAYKKVPGWSEPVRAAEAAELLAHSNPHQFFMDAKLAHQQVMDAKAYSKKSRTEIQNAMFGVKMFDNMLIKILDGGNHKSVTRLHVAYLMAYLNGNTKLPDFPERPARLIIPSLK